MTIHFGGDYNPEQWPEAVQDDDVRLMQRAGVTVATVGVFSWSRLEPREGEFDFGWLDRVFDRLHDGGVRVDLATATASPPPWLAHRHPETLPVTADGARLEVGSRQQYCPSSPVYRAAAARLLRAIAERYGRHPALLWWHVNNEYGCHVSHCYCDVSAAAFRGWLQRRYRTIERLNEVWATAFWSQGYGSFDEIRPPRATPTFTNPTGQLDFDRFSSDELLGCFRAEAAVLRELSPGIPITTNFMGFFRHLDYGKWAAELDFVSDDSYPDPADPNSPAATAMTRDLAKSLKPGTPWVLMEQATGAVQWRERNAPRLPGQFRAYSLQAVARGADAVLQFQWRQSIAGAETFHSAMVPHAGEDSRIFREVEALGAELAAIPDLPAPSPSRVAIVLDWDAWRALETNPGPARTSYVGELRRWYDGLWRRNVAVDFRRPDTDLSGYDLVIVPALFAVAGAALENLAGVVRRGGRLVVGYLTGILDENLHVTEGGYLGALRAALGVRVEEFAPLAAPQPGAPIAPVPVESEALGDFAAESWTELIHADDADVIATVRGGLPDGHPAITLRRDPAGGAGWYVAVDAPPHVIDDLLATILAEAGIEGALADPVDEVEAVLRGDVLTLVNHGVHDRRVPVSGTDVLTGGRIDGDLILGPRGVRVLRQRL